MDSERQRASGWFIMVSLILTSVTVLSLFLLLLTVSPQAFLSLFFSAPHLPPFHPELHVHLSRFDPFFCSVQHMLSYSVSLL